MRAHARPWLSGLTPYRPGSHEARTAGLLASNESSYGAAPEIAAAVGAAAAALHRYPDPTAEELRGDLAARHGVEPAQILVGNGSDELIYLLTWAFAAGGGEVVCAEPAYQLDVLAARVADARVTQVPLVEWRHDLAAMAEVPADLAYLVNPHNPTGTAHPLPAVAAFARHSRARIVVVDEAYVDFAGVGSAVDLAASGEVLVLRTLSKLYGLAGARVGYLVGDAEVLDVLRAIRPPFSVNALAQAAARAALDCGEHYRRVRGLVLRDRERLVELLFGHGLEPVPSEANFVLVPGVDEAGFVACARAVGVAVRPGSSLGVPGCVRISVPDPVGLELLAVALERYRARPR